MAMTDTSVTAAGPVRDADRVETLDVLRGVALFGVFLMNFLGFAGEGIMATADQLAALPTAAADARIDRLAEWLAHDKANTVFAFLFGLGFWLQLSRASAKNANFEAIYLRRLTVLLVFGVLHFVLLWQWDILHVYALAGFALFFLRRLPDRWLLGLGIVLALGARTLQEGLLTAGVLDPTGWSFDPYTDGAVLQRQQLSEAGDYAALLKSFWDFNTPDYFLSGLLVAWIFYALGRFLVGAWVGRKGWLTRPQDHLRGIRRTLAATLPAGLVLEGIATVVHGLMDDGVLADEGGLRFTAEAIHLVGAPVLACGLVCAVVVGLHGRGRSLLRPFRWAGRMALTNYVAQSLVYALVLFGVGPGLALAGRIGSTAVLAIVLAAFAAQVLFSRWWLSRFRWGPLEWIWRGLTYGRWPSLSRAAAA